MKILVNEMFPTIQGEASFTGAPSTFIRLQGCAVGCSWCDTKFTWEKELADAITELQMIAKDSETKQYAAMTVDEIINQCKRWLPKHIVITGGEPFEQDICALTESLIDKGFTVQVETSGTQPTICHSKTWVTVSPKVASEVPLLYSALQRANEIKYPIGKESDILPLLEMQPKIKTRLIWLQPLSQNKKATAACIDLATRCGYRVSFQTHKYEGLK